MPYQGDVAATNPGGTVGVTRTQAPLDLGVGEGGLPAARPTAVVGESRMSGATIPVDGLEQASTVIERAKADLAATDGAETRLNLLDLVGGGGGGAADAAVAAANPDVDQLSTETDRRGQALAGGPTGLTD